MLSRHCLESHLAEAQVQLVEVGPNRHVFISLRTEQSYDQRERWFAHGPAGL